MNALTTKVQQTIARFALLRDGEAVVVALSGGADSVALLLVLAELGYAVEAAHCNFHLREGDADADMVFVEALCARHNVPLHLRHFDTLPYAKAEGISIEMAARTLRYEWFATFERPIAVGHHAEDNAETLLLNLCRGSGLAGLAGIRHRNGQIVRPLLDCRRVDIEAYLAKRGETFCTDATNFDTQYRRNKVRHEVIPLLAELNPDITQTLHETALRLREVEQVYRFGLEQLQQTLMASLPDGFRINYDALTKAPA
ncbi:MAG: tRNA lysidine(34) synthetase TilS, partial [Bacteroidales bacterium]|nr:tRNA lysidine(34) synthetase TilS [Bacteroidales bacterium]